MPLIHALPNNNRALPRSPLRAVSAHPDQVEHRAASEHLGDVDDAGEVESGNEKPIDFLDD